MSDLMSRFFNPKAQKRNASFELLRLYATINVLIRHMSFLVFHTSKDDKEYRALRFLHSLTSTCDNIFVIVSGYFLCTSDLRVSRLFPLIIQNFTYSVGMYLFAICMGWSQFQWIELGKYMLPLTNEVYWFAPPFLITQIAFRPMYKGLKLIHPRYHFLIVVMVCIVAWEAVLGYGKHIAQWGDGTCINLFFQFLLIGSYLRFNKISPSLLTCVIGVIVTAALHFYGMVGDLDWIFGSQTTLGMLLRSDMIFAPLPTLETIFLLLACQKFTISGLTGKLINFIADFNYGIYTCHCHGKVMYQFTGQYSPRKHVILDHEWIHMLYGSFMIYFECLAVEVVRSMLTNFFIVNTSYYSRFCNFVDNYFTPIENIQKEEEAQIPEEEKKKDVEEEAQIPVEDNVSPPNNEEKLFAPL